MMNITLDNAINNSILNTNPNGKEKSYAEKVVGTSSDSIGVILELSKEATQDGFVRVKNVETSENNDVETISLQTEESGGISTMSLAASQVQYYQTCLRTLGFYNGSQDGNPTSTELVKAIKNFQKVYGLTENGNIEETATQDKIKSAYLEYLNCSSSAVTAEIKSAFSLDDTRAKNFALTWTFLKVGMGLTDVQAAGVMGNVFRESGFSSTNAEDSYGYSGFYNTEYNYKTNDEVGYGLLQWTHYSRKEALAEIASDMGLSVGNINAQLALMQYESQNTYKSAWNSLKSCTTVASATEVVMNKIEQPSDTDSITERKNYANIIYNIMT